MKNNRLRSAAMLMSLVVGVTPAMACSTCPRANTSTKTNFMETIPTSAPVTPATTSTPAVPAEPTPTTQQPPKTELKKEDTKDEVTKDETKKEDVKKEDLKKEETEKEETKKEDTKKAEPGAFTIDNFKIIQSALITLGVKQEDLEIQIKEGKKLVDVLDSADITIKKFRKQLIKEYSKVIKEGKKAGQLTREEAKTLKKAVKDKVESWMNESN
ncbi:MAG: hypothetical protein ATN31_10755 [Candidatus Epulonipiscioides saccharophilum]|nr:MAG: hypothetical protein ATN31_10755 [Epulopiscium sp. AS2M-Bin001]